MHLVTEAVKHGLDPDDVIEPKQAWKPVHHHDADRGREKARRKPLKHWKMKEWKRRTATRRAKAAAYLPAD
jgi:hypothetical protein